MLAHLLCTPVMYCIHAKMHRCMHVHMQTNIHEHTNIHAHRYYLHIHIHTNAYMHTHTHIHIHTHSHTHTHTHTHTRTPIRAHTHDNTYTYHHPCMWNLRQVQLREILTARGAGFTYSSGENSQKSALLLFQNSCRADFLRTLTSLQDRTRHRTAQVYRW